MTAFPAGGPRAGRLRHLSGAELDRYFEGRLRAYYVWIGSPRGMDEEGFRRWFDERPGRDTPDRPGTTGPR